MLTCKLSTKNIIFLYNKKEIMLNIFKNQERYAIIKYVKLEQKENPIKRDKSKAEKKKSTRL